MMAASVPSKAAPPKMDSMGTMRVLGLVGEIGYMIAIPAALFGFGGAYIDKALKTSPLFVIVGLIVALASSMLDIWHRVKPFLNS